MADNGYTDLIRGLCALTGITDADAVLERGSVMVKDTLFSIYPGDPNGGPAGALLVYCEFGDVPARREAEVMRRLLEVNLFLSDAPMAAAFVINPDSRRVVFSFRLALNGMRPDALARKLEETARTAERWRKDFFLDAASAKSVSAASFLQGRR